MYCDENGIAQGMEDDVIKGRDKGVMDDCENVEDIASSGLFYTWTKNLKKTKQGDNSGILKKLDRVMRNEAFVGEYPLAHAIFLPYLFSDHCPMILVMLNTIQERKRSFRFSNFVSGKDEFLEIVRENWNTTHNGCQMFKVTRKLKALKKPLKILAWKDGDLFENVKILREKLKDIQKRIDTEPHNKVLREEESSIIRDYGEAMKEEEKLLFQKAKIKWDISNSEIKKVMFMIDDNKAPGPDGYTLHFFKKSWDILGDEVCKVVREFFNTGRILSEINSTVIALVPKIHTPAKVSNYRPIACCNVLYKCLSKVLTERIKKYHGKLVSQNQSAFIPNRQIQDNILIFQELLKGYGRKNGPTRVALKIDLHKAYDTVNWNFLEDILKGFGFHEKMVNWIMKCVTSTSFSIVVNGESCSFFKGGRGLRQGDPMSPYLFTLVMEILNLLMLRKVESNRSFQYHFGCNQLKITHICSADDLLMLCHGDVDSVRIIKEFIEEFRDVSGLLPNYNKSTIIFGSVNDEDRQRILDICPFKVESLPVKYLGVPLITKRLRVKDCKSLVDKRIQANGKAKKPGKTMWQNIWEINEEVGNGSKTSIWFDFWSNMGVLNDTISFRDIYDARMESKLTVKEFYEKYKGQWPDELRTKFPLITQPFRGASLLKTRSENGGTYDMLACPLCLNDMDSHNHLFFNCEFSKRMWQMIKRKSEVKINGSDWGSIIQELAIMQNGNSIGNVVRRLYLATSINLIWQERNNRLFKNAKMNVEELFTNLVDTVTQRLCSLKVKRTKAVEKVETGWNIKLKSPSD
ncbi:RNA-directed DNA polymerase, eukaryota, reverse transcriptase zinc-binding domain protein [Tanacetum coccineum]